MKSLQQQYEIYEELLASDQIESYYTDQQPLLSQKEILDLIRYVQPHSQEIYVLFRTQNKGV